MDKQSSQQQRHQNAADSTQSPGGGETQHNGLSSWSTLFASPAPQQQPNLPQELQQGGAGGHPLEPVQDQAQQPLLPPDGPLLAQQHPAQAGFGALAGQSAGGTPADAQGGMGGLPHFDVNHIHQWINMLGHVPNSGFQAGPGLLMPAVLTQPGGEPSSSRPLLADNRVPVSFQGTGAFAPLRPAQQNPEQAYGHRGEDGGGSAPQLSPQPGFQHPGAASHEVLWGGSVVAQPEGAPMTAAEFSQQPFAQTAGEGQPPQTHHSFEHLVESASQHYQTGYRPRAGGGSAPSQVIRPQPHKPPQATKSSRYRGVYKRQRGGRWEASIVLDGKNCRLGLHMTELAAARAYDRVAIKKWGVQEAATKVNFEPTQYNLAELDEMSMDDLVRAVRAEWRTKDAHQQSPSASLYDSQDGVAPPGAALDPPPSMQPLEGPRESPSKRQRVDGLGNGLQNGGPSTHPPDPHGSPALLDTAHEETETRERVPMARSSMYRGVSTHKQSGKWVAQIKSAGKQIYLGFYSDQADAARAYDQAVIHMQGDQAETNFPLDHYSDRLQQLQKMEFKDLVAALKQHGRGGAPRQPRAEASRFRGVAPDKSKKWRAQITTSARTTVYLGLWAEEEAAARAYDRANIAKRGEAAKTNFPISQYTAEAAALSAIPFDSLVTQLRAEAVASVAADKAAKRDASGPATILAPLPSMDGAEERARYLETPGSYLASELAGEQYPQNTAFQIGQAQIGRFGAAPNQGLAQGYLINRHAPHSRPDVLFRVVNRDDAQSLGDPG